MPLKSVRVEAVSAGAASRVVGAWVEALRDCLDEKTRCRDAAARARGAPVLRAADAPCRVAPLLRSAVPNCRERRRVEGLDSACAGRGGCQQEKQRSTAQRGTKKKEDQGLGLDITIMRRTAVASPRAGLVRRRPLLGSILVSGYSCRMSQVSNREAPCWLRAKINFQFLSRAGQPAGRLCRVGHLQVGRTGPRRPSRGSAMFNTHPQTQLDFYFARPDERCRIYVRRTSVLFSRYWMSRFGSTFKILRWRWEV